MSLAEPRDELEISGDIRRIAIEVTAEGNVAGLSRVLVHSQTIRGIKHERRKSVRVEERRAFLDCKAHELERLLVGSLSRSSCLLATYPRKRRGYTSGKHTCCGAQVRRINPVAILPTGWLAISTVGSDMAEDGL